MKHIILYALLGIFLFSCHSSIDNRAGFIVLQKADSLMQCRPDSSLSLLQNIKKADILPEADRAYYALLLTQARDKNYIKHSTDSLIRMAVAYYDSKDDIALRMKSHYYLARVYQDMDSVSATVRELMIARQYAEENNDSDFIYLSSVNLGYLLKHHNLLDEADLLYQQVENMAVSNNDSLRLAIALMNRTDICIMRGEKHYQKAEKNLLCALEIARAIPAIQIEQAIITSLGALYSSMGHYMDVLHWEHYYLSIQPDSLKRFGSYFNLGNAFYQMQMNDSAFYYLLKSTHSRSSNTKKGAYEILSKLAEKEGLLIESLNWKDSCLAYMGLSCSLARPIEAITSLKNIVNQQSTRRHERSRKRQWYIIAIITSLLLITFLYLLQKNKKTQIQLLRLKKELSTGKAQIDYKDKEIAQLNKLIKECQNDRAKVAILNKQLDDICAERDKLFEHLIHHLPSFKALTSLLKNNRRSATTKELIDIKLWKEIVMELNSITDGFTIHLAGKYPMLKIDDIYFCCLLKMGFKYSDIACLLGRTTSMMYKRRNLITERIKLDETFTLEALIKSF